MGNDDLSIERPVLLPLVCIRPGREERMLINHFGEEYRRYRESTWRLLPGIY